MTYDLAAISATMKAIAALIDAGLDPVSPVEPQPEPVEPTPVDPVPVPVDPTPVDPVPVDPAPVDPAPVDPVPVDPAPPVIGRTIATDAADLQAKLAAAVDGDTIGLKGEFGDIYLANVNKSVRIVGEAIDQAHFDKLRLGKCSGLTFEGFTVYPRVQPVITNVKQFAVQVDSGSDITFDGLLIRGREDSDTFENWTAQDWLDWRMGAIWTRGARCKVLNTRAIGVQNGFSLGGDGSEMRNSRVEGFSDDAMRITASDSGSYGCFVSDRVKINEDHPDAFQIFGTTIIRNVTVSGLVVKDRTRVISDTLWAYLQGVSLFNGPYENVTIEGCDLAVSSYHGIAVGNINGLVIRNNILRPGHKVIKSGYPHIQVSNGKGGEIPQNVQVYDNTAPRFNLASVPADQLIQYNNVVV